MTQHDLVIKGGLGIISKRFQGDGSRGVYHIFRYALKWEPADRDGLSFP
jgi:hypothetical protein